MSPDPELISDTITMVLTSISGVALILSPYLAYRRCFKQLDDGASPEALKGALAIIPMAAGLALGGGMAIGVGLAKIGGQHRWMAAAALSCVVAFILVFILKTYQNARAAHRQRG
jgi:hypothetical protein